MNSRLPKRLISPALLSIAFVIAASAPPRAAFAANDAATPKLAAETVIPLMAPEEFKRQQQWRDSIAAKPQPKKGCFTAKFPSLEWQEVPCVDGPKVPMLPRSGIVPQTVGNGDDIAAQAPSGTITSASGSFDSLTNVTSEEGPIANAGAKLANAYTLQINTDFFTTTVCNASPTASCRGWEQFVFENNPSNHRAFIQYWLINFDTTCPANFQSFPLGGHTDCVQLSNLSGAVGTTAVPVTNLGQVTLTGNATAAGDSITMTIGNTAFTRNGDNSVNASSGWSIAEFNILGDGGDTNGVGSLAEFNANASLVARTRINYGGTAAPICVAQGFTAERNNLSFGPAAPAASQPGPAVIFTESRAGGAPSNCAASTAVGDTHLTTLSGLLYDFQATGDFDLIQTASGFEVQNRQVNGAPNWPNAAISSAIAADLGTAKAALCLGPERVVVDGQALPLRSGDVKELGDGAQVSHNGNSYLFRNAKGDWVKADVQGNHIDVRVGLGQWPMNAQGLLVNKDADPHVLAPRDGPAIKTPFRFEEFYKRYGESWRVRPGDSMLNVCGEIRQAGIPSKPFYAKNLDKRTALKARKACQRAGVREGALLDACMIDVAFTGDVRAAIVHAKTRPPVAVGLIQ